MAYNDYGAFVYQLVDGKRVRRTDREDVAVFDEYGNDLPSGARIYTHLSRRMLETGNTEGGSWDQHPQHAVLGDGPVRLSGYKGYLPYLWHLKEDGLVHEVPWNYFHPERQDDDPHGSVTHCVGEYADCYFSVHRKAEFLLLRLEEADGTVWTAKCGSMYGTGHMKGDRPWHLAKRRLQELRRRAKYRWSDFWYDLRRRR